MQGRNKKTFKAISADTLVLFLLTLAAFSRWDLLANPLAPSGSVLEKFPRVLAPFLRLFLPAEGAVLFSPYRWMLVSLLVLFLLVYLVLDVVRNLEGEGLRLPFGLNFGRLVFGIKTAILIYIVAVIVILPALQQISRRHSSQRPWEFANDNVVQTEEAIRFVVSGRNPYREDYLRTPMVRFHSDSENRALHHFVYMPSDVLLSIPFYLFSKRFVGWYDQRFVYLLLFVLLLWILPRFAQEEEKKLSLLAIFALNPFVAPFVVEGRNDVFTLFWIVLSVHFLLRQRNALSVVSLAVAGTHKLFALLLLPFYWVYLLGTTSLSRREMFEGLRSRKKEIALFLLTVGVILLPFVFWDFGAFIDDVWLYGVGRTFKSMPVEGPTTFGVGSLVLYAGAVKSIDAYFPFWIFQLAAGLPLLVYFLRKQAGTGSMQIAILGYSIVLFVALFFSRFFHDNYLGFVVTLLAWASLGDFDSTVRNET